MSEPQSRSNGSVVVSHEKEWKPMKFPGVSMKVLHVFPDGGSTVLIRMDPGSTFPVHDHLDDEETYLLEGDIRIGKYELVQGDYIYTPPGVVHASRTKHGCTLLATTRKPLQFIKRDEKK